MEAAVIGAGVIGVTTAHCLQREGLRVTVFERHGAAAQETSAANAGLIAPAYVTPWAQPGMPAKVLSYLLSADAPVRIRPRLDLQQWRWLARAVRECRLDRFRRNKARMQRLALYSRSLLHEVRARLGIDDHQSRGCLQLYRDQRELERAAPARALLAEGPFPHQLLTPERCRALEPALRPDAPLAGGLFMPEDEAGDCAAFTARLQQICAADGVRFRFGTAVTALACAGDRITVHTAAGPQAPDVVVVAAGVDSARLLRPLGLSLPLYPVKGYSVTVPLLRPDRAPAVAIMDEAYKVAITRMGDRLRVAGTAEIGGRALTARPALTRSLIRIARHWFPEAGDYPRAASWVGARPMLPDGPPLLGAGPWRNLFLNLGHGSSGWAMACGSAQIVADLIAGRPPAIDLEGLTLARYA